MCGQLLVLGPLLEQAGIRRRSLVSHLFLKENSSVLLMRQSSENFNFKFLFKFISIIITTLGNYLLFKIDSFGDLFILCMNDSNSMKTFKYMTK